MAGIIDYTLNIRASMLLMFSLYCTAWFFYTLAYATPYWTKEVSDTISYEEWAVAGIWEVGVLYPTSKRDWPGDIIELFGLEWYKAVQAFTTIGLIALFSCLVLVSLFMVIRSINNKATIIVLTAAGFGTFVVMMIGIIIYAAESQFRLGLSFGFAIIGAAFTLTGAVVSVLHLFTPVSQP